MSHEHTEHEAEVSFEDASAPPATQTTSSSGTGEPDTVIGPDAEVAEGETIPGPEAPAGVPAEDPEASAPDYLALAQRTKADFDNYRRRMTREVAQAGDRGAAKLAKELLPALDHLELALKAASDSDETRGFAMVHQELLNGLGRAGIEPFSPLGEAFDPTEHEAMASQPAEDAAPGSVIEVYQRGYRLNGSVLRPARVVVAQ